MKNRYRSGEAALPFFPFRYNKDNTLILCRCAYGGVAGSSAGKMRVIGGKRGVEGAHCRVK